MSASLATLLAFFAPTPLARADIFQWEYINPADPSLGKQPSTTLAPDGAGVHAVPGANLSNRNLTMAYLIGANLYSYTLYDEYGYEIRLRRSTDLTGANLSQADLTNANLYRRHADRRELHRRRSAKGELVNGESRRLNSTRRPATRPTI